ncbi:MAG: zinc metallopeptidase [Clostridia bacterium]|jgi:Zn-dependent membrane protease YugP|nr:zinc metallopeptidase [Clostridia bacterium]MBR3714960.1 zinc metallopeptidase [Clostridia bacterium]
MFYIDWTYIILVMPAVIFATWASMRVNTTFEKYSRQLSARRMTGAEAARRVLSANGIYDVQIMKIKGNLTDHYDPRANVIRLSEAVHDGISTAAIGVAAHEAGHAVQHAQNYAPVKIRSAIVPITNVGSKLSIPLILLGIMLSYLGPIYSYIAYAGVAAFGLCVVFQLVTLPTEFNASSRALVAIEQCGILSTEEIKGSRKVLSAAALTYVAALAVTLMQFLRLFLIVAGSNNRRR